VSAVTKIVVTISRIDARVEAPEVHGPNDDVWTTISTTPATLDVLAAPTRGFTTLLVAKLPASGLERLRLQVSRAGPNYVVTANGVRHDVAIFTDEIDVVGDFDVEQCATGSVSLVFSGKRSLWVHPAADGGGDWILRPVVRVSQVMVNGVPCGDDDGDQGRGPLFHE
jgi:hypothetical protein